MRTPALHSTGGGQAQFASTQWGVLLAAGGADRAGGIDTRVVWENLYRIYCRPIYSFIRRRGHPRPEAQDLTQDFFVHLIERGTLARADREKGRFRSYLLGAMEYFLVDATRRDDARKRGGGRQFLFLDDPDTAEGEYQLRIPAWETPERLFDASWAAALLAEVFTRLHNEMARAGKERFFDVLKDYVTGAEDASYQQAADALELSLPALKSTIHRLRLRYAALLREEIARTVASPAEIEEEVRHLRAVLRAD